MTILRIEHPVPNFDGWKKVFDSDPINRKNAGVKHYRIYRPVNDPNFAIVDLEFNDLVAAENVLAALRKLWEKVEGSLITGPQARIFDVVESIDL